LSVLGDGLVFRFLLLGLRHAVPDVTLQNTLAARDEEVAVGAPGLLGSLQHFLLERQGRGHGGGQWRGRRWRLTL